MGQWGWKEGVWDKAIKNVKLTGLRDSLDMTGGSLDKV